MSSSLPLLNDEDCSMTGFDSQAHPSFSLSDIKTEIKTDIKTEVSFLYIFSSTINLPFTMVGCHMGVRISGAFSY